MGCAVHLWTGFVSVICYGTFLPTLPGFTPHHRMMKHAGVSGEAFQGVTLSFHLSNYQFTELIKTALCAAFSAANKSHGYSALIFGS